MADNIYRRLLFIYIHIKYGYGMMGSAFTYFHAVLRIRNPVFRPLAPGSRFGIRDGRKFRSRSGMNNRIFFLRT
jgi:hypothetical protein